MVHIWMIHKRLLAEGDDGQRVQEGLFDELWEDTTNRIRAQGVGEMSVSCTVKALLSIALIELTNLLCILVPLSFR